MAIYKEGISMALCQPAVSFDWAAPILVLFNNLISDLNEDIQGGFIKFADNSNWVEKQTQEKTVEAKKA